MTDRELEFLKNVLVSLEAGQYVNSDDMRRVVALLIRQATSNK